MSRVLGNVYKKQSIGNSISNAIANAIATATGYRRPLRSMKTNTRTGWLGGTDNSSRSDFFLEINLLLYTKYYTRCQARWREGRRQVDNNSIFEFCRPTHHPRPNHNSFNCANSFNYVNRFNCVNCFNCVNSFQTNPPPPGRRVPRWTVGAPLEPE